MAKAKSLVSFRLVRVVTKNKTGGFSRICMSLMTGLFPLAEVGEFLSNTKAHVGRWFGPFNLSDPEKES
jgi:hypothetical protein